MSTEAGTALALNPSVAEELEYRSVPWPERARTVRVVDQASYDAAGELVTGIKTLRKEIDDATGPVIRATNAAHKAATQQKSKLEGPLIEAEMIVKATMVRWKDADDRRRAEEQRRLDEAARRAEEDARVAEAAALEAAGEPDLAERVLEAPSIAPPPVLPPAPKTDGIQTRKNWKCQVDDVRKLCAAVASGAAPVTLVLANQSALDGMARSLKEGFAVPGCRAVCETTIAAGRR